MRPESLICTSDDKHPWPFHIGVPPPPPLGVKHPPSKAVLQSLAPCQVSYFLNFWCKYSISYRRNPLHWINFHKNVFMNSSYCNYINSSFPEGACSYRFNHSWLPKKKKDIESHKTDDLYEFSIDSSRDWMSLTINSQKNWREFELFIYTIL